MAALGITPQKGTP